MSSRWFKDFFDLLKSTVVYNIIAVTVVVYFFQLMGAFGERLTLWGMLQPDLLVKGHIWRLLSYGFLHSFDLFHVAFNMLGLWFFGRELEEFWGSKKFLTFYLFAIIVSGLLSLLNIPMGYGSTPIVGASGAVYGVLFAYAAYFPGRELYLYLLIRIPVRVAVVLLTLISAAGVLRSPDGVAHWVHLGGFFSGWLFYIHGDALMTFLYKRKRKRQKGTTFYDFKVEETPDLQEILRKIHRSGINSLTTVERKVLEDSSKGDV